MGQCPGLGQPKDELALTRGSCAMSLPLLPGRPDRPRDLELTDLAERSVRLTWIPGDDNNSPITGPPGALRSGPDKGGGGGSLGSRGPGCWSRPAPLSTVPRLCAEHVAPASPAPPAALPVFLARSDYVVQFEEDQFQPGVWHDHSKFPGTVNSAVLQLSPYVNYQFRVIAVNEVGSSHPSLPSERYRTSGAREYSGLTE